MVVDIRIHTSNLSLPIASSSPLGPLEEGNRLLGKFHPIYTLSTFQKHLYLLEKIGQIIETMIDLALKKLLFNVEKKIKLKIVDKQ